MTSTRGRDAAKAAGWLAAGAIGATALTGVAFAANNDATPSPSTPSTTAPERPESGGTATNPGDQNGDQQNMRRGPGGPGQRGGPGMMGGAGGRVMHGDVTVKDENDEATQARIQSGTIESASATSITVKSEDGYTSTWILNADTKVHRDRSDATATDLKQGDFVSVRGPLSGDTATAKSVRALSADAKAEFDKMQAERKAERDARGSEQDSDEGSNQGSNSSSSASSALYF